MNFHIIQFFMHKCRMNKYSYLFFQSIVDFSFDFYQVPAFKPLYWRSKNFKNATASSCTCLYYKSPWNSQTILTLWSTFYVAESENHKSRIIYTMAVVDFLSQLDCQERVHSERNEWLFTKPLQLYKQKDSSLKMLIWHFTSCLNKLYRKVVHFTTRPSWPPLWYEAVP